MTYELHTWSKPGGWTAHRKRYDTVAAALERGRREIGWRVLRGDRIVAEGNALYELREKPHIVRKRHNYSLIDAPEWPGWIYRSHLPWTKWLPQIAMIEWPDMWEVWLARQGYAPGSISSPECERSRRYEIR